MVSDLACVWESFSQFLLWLSIIDTHKSHFLQVRNQLWWFEIWGLLLVSWIFWENWAVRHWISGETVAIFKLIEERMNISQLFVQCKSFGALASLSIKKTFLLITSHFLNDENYLLLCSLSAHVSFQKSDLTYKRKWAYKYIYICMFFVLILGLIVKYRYCTKGDLVDL